MLHFLFLIKKNKPNMKCYNFHFFLVTIQSSHFIGKIQMIIKWLSLFKDYQSFTLFTIFLYHFFFFFFQSKKKFFNNCQFKKKKKIETLLEIYYLKSSELDIEIKDYFPSGSDMNKTEAIFFFSDITKFYDVYFFVAYRFIF